MSFLKFKPIEPVTTTPAGPAEVFTVPAQCWKCANRYQCANCPNGLKEPLTVSRQGWGTSKPFYFGFKSKTPEPVKAAPPPPPQQAPAGAAACQVCRQLATDGYCKQYGEPASTVRNCTKKEKAYG